MLPITDPPKETIRSSPIRTTIIRNAISLTTIPSLASPRPSKYGPSQILATQSKTTACHDASSHPFQQLGVPVPPFSALVGSGIQSSVLRRKASHSQTSSLPNRPRDLMPGAFSTNWLLRVERVPIAITVLHHTEKLTINIPVGFVLQVIGVCIYQCHAMVSLDKIHFFQPDPRRILREN